MAMKLIREAKKTEYKVENGKTLIVMQPEIYQRIYCKNCGNEVIQKNRQLEPAMTVENHGLSTWQKT